MDTVYYTIDTSNPYVTKYNKVIDILDIQGDFITAEQLEALRGEPNSVMYPAYTSDWYHDLHAQAIYEYLTKRYAQRRPGSKSISLNCEHIRSLELTQGFNRYYYCIKKHKPLETFIETYSVATRIRPRVNQQTQREKHAQQRKQWFASLDPNVIDLATLKFYYRAYNQQMSNPCLALRAPRSWKEVKSSINQFNGLGASGYDLTSFYSFLVDSSSTPKHILKKLQTPEFVYFFQNPHFFLTKKTT